MNSLPSLLPNFVILWKGKDIKKYKHWTMNFFSKTPYIYIYIYIYKHTCISRRFVLILAFLAHKNKTPPFL